ncbi:MULTISPECIES: Rha family transcriptional regulator [Pseudomonas]|uniref:Phage regulatory protein Rha (Phage_pRha) n=1 Tax=Pseudomonas lutea TaxID=243924 RepID=A0A9X8QM41_9PSED|nr:MULTISPECIES: Rha family transcriptional regulator [Pseudomonas]SER51473.1 Phage regulatory protein Rha (Phage_pRha) [Pseudomonas lutea]
MQNLINTSDAVTMSSREIADLVGKRHDQVLRTARELVMQGVTQSVETPYLHEQNGQYYPEHRLNKRDSLVLVARLSPEFTAKVVDRWLELEEQAAKPRELTRMELIQLAYEAEQQRMQLAAQVQEQAVKIVCMENLFKEGMTAPQFCKALNGVNVMQVCSHLETKGWLYNESKSGTRWRVASYARDRYMTEHQNEVAPHGHEPFISYTPVLLQKGAQRLYDLYLKSELPMKKTWDGLFTHDKALKGAA